MEVAKFQNCGGTLPRPSDELRMAWGFIPNQLAPLPLEEYFTPLVDPPPMSAESGMIDVMVPNVNMSPIVIHRARAVIHQSDEYHTFEEFFKSLLPPTIDNQVETIYTSSYAGSGGYPAASRNSQTPILHGNNTNLSQELKNLLAETVETLTSQGTKVAATKLLERGIETSQSATAVAKIIGAMRREPLHTRCSDFYSQLRCAAIDMFRHHWGIVCPFAILVYHKLTCRCRMIPRKRDRKNQSTIQIVHREEKI
jgi:hypothetical protein